MAYCCRCGKEVQDNDQFCAKCGAPQANARPPADFVAGLTPRTASILCYIPWVGWIAAIVILASSTFRNDRTVRFNAFQGLYLFVAWLIVEWVFMPLPFPPMMHFPLRGVLHLAIIAVWVFMLVKTNQDQKFSLPVLGDLAEKSMAE